MAWTAEEIIRRALTGQSGLGKHPSQLSGSKIGMAPDPTMLRRGADTLEGRNFTGSIPRAPMAGLNPTNAEAFGLDTWLSGNPIPWNDPHWMAPAYYGHDESMQYEMARMVAQQAAEQAVRNQTTMGNVAAGSNNPIYYPPPGAAPNRPESQQMGYAQQDMRVHGAPGSAQRREY